MHSSAELAFLMALLLTSVYSNYTSIYNCTVDRAPSHGDLWLLPGNGSERLVMIYMGQDGTDDPKMWGTLSGNDNQGKWAETLCHQLGYMEFNRTIKPPKGYDSGSSRVWLSDLNCPEDNHEKHILRCKSTFSDSQDHSYDIHLSCSIPLVSQPGSAYIGQGALLPPIVDVPANKCNRSVSYGVAIFKHDDKWQYIRQNTDFMLTLNDTNTICRELGFTHSVPNSLMKVGQTDDEYNFYNFGAVSSSQFNCQASHQCIGCCFDLSSTKNFAGTSHTDALVLRCSFYSPVRGIRPVTGGYEEICEEVVKNKHESVCPFIGASGSSNYELPFQIVVPILSTLLIVAVLVLAIIAVVALRNRRRRGYDRFPMQDGDAHGENRQ